MDVSGSDEINLFLAHANGIKRIRKNAQLVTLVPLSEAYPDINRVSENGSVSVRRSARLGVGKRRISTNRTP